MAGPADYIIGAGDSLGAVGKGAAGIIKSKQGLSGVQKYIARILAGEDPYTVSVEARAAQQGLLNGQETGQISLPSAPAGSLGGGAPQQGAPAMASLGGIQEPGAEQYSAGPPMRQPLPVPQTTDAAMGGPVGRPMASAVSGSPAPGGAPMPQNQEEYAQLLQGVGVVGELAKARRQPNKPLTADDRIRIIREGEAARQPGRMAIAERLMGGRKEIAEIREGGENERFNAKEKREQTQGDRDLEIKEGHLKLAREWAYGKLQEIKDKKGKADSNEKRQIAGVLQRDIANLRNKAQAYRKGDIAGDVTPENEARAAEMDRKAYQLEKTMMQLLGPDALNNVPDEEMPEYFKVTKRPDGKVVGESKQAPSPMDIYNYIQSGEQQGDFGDFVNEGEGEGQMSGEGELDAPPLPTDVEVQEPQGASEFRRTKDGRILRRDPNGRITRIA